MGVLLGREKRQFAPEPIIPPYPGANVFGSSTGDPSADALTVPTVWACVSLLANAVSMLPLETFRRVGDGTALRVNDPQLLVRPAATMTQSEWLHMLMVSLLLRGNAYGRIVSRDGMLRPQQIELLNPDLVQLRIDSNGHLTYRYMNAGKQTDITADMWHVRGLTLPGGFQGLSPISYAAATLGVDLSARKFAQDFFNGGGIPKSIITSDRDIKQDGARTIKERLTAATQNREPIVMANGLKYQAISVNPEESQFLQTQQASISQIARYFGVPAGLVGGTEGGSLTYSNVEQRSIDFLTFGVSFWLKRIEDAVFALLPQPQFVRFNTAALLRTDAETQAKVDNMRLAGKTQAPSEIRAGRNEPPMTQAQKEEVQMVPLEVTPMGGAKAIAAAGATPPDEPDLTEGTHADA